MADPKAATVDLISDKADEEGNRHEAYDLITDLIRNHHPDLCEAGFHVFRNYSWKIEDVARPTLARVDIYSPMDWQVHGKDFKVQINQAWWADPATTGEQKRAVFDELLCSVALKRSKDDDEPVKDDAGKTYYGKVPPDFRGYRAAFERHGCFTDDLREMARIAAIQRRAAGDEEDDDVDGDVE